MSDTHANTHKGPSIKDVRIWVDQCGHFTERGFFRCRRPNFYCKNFGFFESYGVIARTWGEELSQCGHFSDNRGVKFFRFCADVFYGRSLTSAKFDFAKILFKIIIQFWQV